MGIFQCFRCIGEKTLHFLRRLDIILASLITHPVLISQFLSCLKAEKNVVSLSIFCSGIMDIISCHKINACLLMHPHQLLIYHLLGRNAMILKLQEEIFLSKNILIPKCCRLGLLVHTAGQIPGHFSCKAGA